MLRLALAGIALLALCGCASLTPETAAEESAWLSLHVIDTAQTVNFRATHGRVHEVESAWVIGREPKRSSVYAYMGSMAALHVGAAAYMDANDWPRWARRFFEALSIADAANCVRGNYQLEVGAHF